MKDGKFRFLTGEKGNSAVRCAVFCLKDGLRRCEVGPHRPGSPTSITLKTVVMAMKSLLRAKKGDFSFAIFGAVETFVWYR